MKKRIVTFLLAAAIGATSLLPGLTACAATNFTDVPANTWYTEAVNYAVEAGMFQGTSATTFSPNGSMTRAMFVEVLSRIAGADTSSAKDAGFADVPDAWYTDAVNWAAENGYVAGLGNNKFGPTNPVTREQIATMLSRYITKTGQEMTPDEDAVSSFKDADKVSNYAKEAVDQMREWGLIAGDNLGNFNPKKNVTRAETATILMRYDMTQDEEGGNTENPGENPGGGGGTGGDGGNTPGGGDTDPDTPVNPGDPNGDFIYTEPAGDPVATLPGNIPVYEEAEDMTNVASELPAMGAVTGEDAKPILGDSTEGLTYPGTEPTTGNIIEEQKYVKLGENLTGIYTRTYKNGVRSAQIEAYVYAGETFTITKEMLGTTSVPAGYTVDWSFSYDEDDERSKIEVERSDNNSVTFRTTTSFAGNYVQGLILKMNNADYSDTITAPIGITFHIYDEHPKEGKTYFTVEPQYNTTFATKAEKDEYLNEWYGVASKTSKDEDFDVNNLDNATWDKYFNMVTLYPTENMEVDSADLNEDGSIINSKVSKYFTSTVTPSTPDCFLDVRNGSIGAVGWLTKGETRTYTVTYVCRQNGATQSIELTGIGI